MLSRGWLLRGQASGREHLAGGETRGVFAGLVKAQPDLTLDEVVAEMRRQRISERHNTRASIGLCRGGT
jgi:hypothetical protein